MNLMRHSTLNKYIEAVYSQGLINRHTRNMGEECSVTICRIGHYWGHWMFPHDVMIDYFPFCKDNNYHGIDQLCCSSLFESWTEYFRMIIISRSFAYHCRILDLVANQALIINFC